MSATRVNRYTSNSKLVSLLASSAVDDDQDDDGNQDNEDNRQNYFQNDLQRAYN